MNEIDWKAYDEGYSKCRQVDNDNSGGSLNPYPKGTDSWKSWNLGWNTWWPQKKL